jgi:hypothetical protein
MLAHFCVPQLLIQKDIIMFKRSFISKKGSLLVLTLVSTVMVSQLVRADQPNASDASIDAQLRARNAMLGAQIPAREQNVSAGAFVDPHQRARNLIDGSAQITLSNINVATGPYIDPHQRGRDAMVGAIQIAPSGLQVAKQLNQ